ncbi:MAG: trypsin-like serine protease, partial [Bdellovibrionales bacterium]|nr:trypsin-like serine protease [Bdellovibrionales bacterium]
MLRSTVRAALFFAIFGFAVGTEKAHAAIYNTFTALNQADEFALDATFSSVGLFVGTSVNGIETIAGSGVLIDPWWVLTAGHVPFSSPGQYYQSMEFNLAPNVGQNLDQFVGAAAFFTFPGYSSNIPAGQGDDIGLVRLSEPIFSVTPAQRFYGQDQEGTVMTM